MASLFDTLQAQAFRAGVSPRTKQSQQWFQRNVRKLSDVNRKELLQDNALDTVVKNPISLIIFIFDNFVIKLSKSDESSSAA